MSDDPEISTPHPPTTLERIRQPRASTSYVCAQCRETFDYSDDWTEEDAAAECVENGMGDREDLVTVCDDCYRLGAELFGWAAPRSAR